MDTDTKQTDGNGRPLFSYSRGHDTSKKYESGNSADGLDYYTSLAYAREVKMEEMPAKRVFKNTIEGKI